MRRNRIHVSAKATSGMPCMAAETAARVARIFHRMARMRILGSSERAIESAAATTSFESP